MHTLTPNAHHAVVTVHLAMPAEKNPHSDDIADGLNQFFQAGILSGLLADYAFYHTDMPNLVVAPPAPEAGSLFTSPAMAEQALLLDFARHVIDFCRYRQQKERPIDLDHINVGPLVMDYMHTRENSEG